jgi:hypothetical protein
MSTHRVALALAAIAASCTVGGGVAAASYPPAVRAPAAAVPLAAGAALGSGPGPHHCGTNTNPCPK